MRMQRREVHDGDFRYSAKRRHSFTAIPLCDIIILLEDSDVMPANKAHMAVSKKFKDKNYDKILMRIKKGKSRIAGTRC